jgi:hypothetical protein
MAHGEDRGGGAQPLDPRAHLHKSGHRGILANGLHLNCVKGGPCDPDF